MHEPVYTLWKQAPFLRIIIPLMTGIICADYFPLNIIIDSITSLCTFSIFILLFILTINIKFISITGKTAVLYLFLFSFGIFLTLYHDAKNRSNFAGRLLQDTSTIVLKLREPLTEKPASWKTVADIISIENDGQFHKATGKAILYFQKTDSIAPCHYGDVVLAKNILQIIRNSGNPGSFDYERYCHLQNIFYQGYIPQSSWHLLSVTQKRPLKSFFLSCRSWCLQTLALYIHDQRSLGLAQALLAGYRDNMDKDLVQAYANAGVVHIIAISGLHLGLIYLVLLFILKPFPDKGRWRWLKGIIIILSLWCFAMITGAAPSALRAAVMLSFIVIAKFFIERQTNIYNTLAASAFLLLCYDPYRLFNVGFQLSYLAVLGIVIFQKPVYALLISDNKIWNYIWKMMSVSIAAEITTFPLAIFYFHRFPAMFLAANLMVVPLATFILYGEIILLLLSFFKPLAIIAGLILSKSIAFMNSIIEWLNGISLSGLSGIFYTSLETILLYALVASGALWLLQKKKFAFLTVLLFFLLFNISRMFYAIHASQQKKMIVYNIPRYHALDFVEGRSVKFTGDSAVLLNKVLTQNTLNLSRDFLHTVLRDSLNHFMKNNHLVQFFNSSMMIVDSKITEEFVHPFPVDYVLISHNPNPDFRNIQLIFSPKLLIFDASNSLWKTKQWKTVCDSLNLRYFSVQEEGAWVADVE